MNTCSGIRWCLRAAELSIFLFACKKELIFGDFLKRRYSSINDVSRFHELSSLGREYVKIPLISQFMILFC